MTEIGRTSLGGVRVFFADGPPPFVGAILFRVGRVDEQAASCGITHLVEHLTLPVTGRRALDYNGSVDNVLTSFWASGEPDLVLPFLGDTSRRLAALPLHRLETERNVLLAEEAIQGANPVRLAFALRFGPVGHGLVGYDEFGLRKVDADDVAEWAATRFVDGNAAVWLTGPADALELELLSGPRHPLPPPRELEELEFPSFYGQGPYGVLAFSLLARRSTALAAALSTLAHRVEQRIRYDLGLSYSPSTEVIPLTDELAHVVVVVDAMAVNSDRVIEETLAVLDELAADGPNDEELDDERRLAERSLTDPTEVTRELYYATAQHLLGAEFRQPAELAAERTALRSEEVAAALRETLDTLLVIAPDDAERPARLAEYPLSSSHAVAGREHRTRGFSLRPKRIPALVVGPEGVTLRSTPDRHVTARFDDCVAALRYPDGSRTLLTDDGFFLPVDPGLWRDGRDAVRAVDAAIPAARTVRIEPELTSRVDAVEEVAHRSVKRRWLVSEELEELPQRLEAGETPLAFLSATKGIRAGLLVATDRRLLFHAKIFGEEWLEWSYGQLRGMRRGRNVWGSTLVVEAPGGDVSFGEVKKRDVDRFLDEVLPLLAQPS